MNLLYLVRIVLIAGICWLIATTVAGQENCESTSFGNTFIHEQGESVVFGRHNFVNGGYGVLPGLVGTERSGVKGYFGFSDVSPGWVGIGNDRHVDGYVKIYSDKGFVFPIGDNGKYRPAAISGGQESSAAYFGVDPNLAITSDLFGGESPPLPAGAPFPRSSRNVYIDKISNQEYWDIDGDVPTKITLTWDFNSDIANLTSFDIQKLTIVGWNGSEWIELRSVVDILYLKNAESTPFFFGGVSSLTTGSITTTVDVIPNDYDAYTFGSLAVAIVGDYVWEDLNRNGIQEDGEPGVPDVTIQLLDETGQIYKETTTDENGNFYFTFIPKGIYRLSLVLPENYQITLPGQGDPLYDSDLGFNGKTPPFSLVGNETFLSLDAGLYRTTEVGDFVWLDENQDGVQQPDETGVAGVRVELLDKDKEILASTITNSSGSYRFTNLPPGSYFIRFVVPPSYELSPYHATLDRNIDSDAHPETGLSDELKLVSGVILHNIDAGLSAPCDYIANVEYGPSFCGGAVGFITTTIEGSSGPYTYLWSTGDTIPNLFNLEADTYTLIISDTAGCKTTFIVDIFNAIPCEPVCADLDAAVFLEGTYNEDLGEMNNWLNQLGYLPGQQPVTFFGKYTEPGQPYNRDPYFHRGTEGLNFESATTANNNDYYDPDVVDWVLVSLRSKIDLEYEACTRAGMLKKDGTIEFVEGQCCLVDPSKDYYVVIEHRNHLVVMSKEKVPVVDSTITYDFRNEQSYTRLFGYGQKELNPGTYAMYAGNGDQYLDGESPVDINVGDLTEWLKENGKHSSYYIMDFDLNGDANVQDKGYYLENIGIFTDVPKN